MQEGNLPIGIFDSGIGGLSVYTAIRALMPSANLIYVADSSHLPYGDRSLDEIFLFSKNITEFLIEKGCPIIVIACNTASAAALNELRLLYPQISFVGMEPAVKPAAEQTLSGTVGVIATVATFQGPLFKSVVERFAQGVRVIEQPCPGLVQLIEAGNLAGEETEQLLRGWLQPMLDANIDSLVLGCTHYPFITPLLQKICGPDVRIINPAPAIAKQVLRIAEDKKIYTIGNIGADTFYTSGSTHKFEKMGDMLGITIPEVHAVVWEDDGLREG
jgi:glutamate racemase